MLICIYPIMRGGLNRVREVKVLVRFEILLLKKNLLYNILVFLITFLIPMFLYLSTGTKDKEMWVFLLHGQLFFCILAMPILYSFLYDDDKQAMIYSTIIPKLHSNYLYLVCKVCVLWGIIFLSQSSCLILILGGHVLFYGVNFFDLILPLIYTSFTTIGISVQIAALLSLLLKKQVYVNIFNIIFLVIGMSVNSPAFSIWFNPDWITSHFFDSSFFVGRTFILCIALILMYFSNRLWKARGRL